ncbi:MAG: hypothetical protein PHZ09_05455 [Eubacteriales bacterium]|jgi:hypothetical protein|nr:hypothetical protein [Eubacteriales bacterium]
MKKIFRSITLFTVLAFIFALSASAVGTYWVFDDEATVLGWADKNTNGGEIGYEDGLMVIYIGDGGDPYFQHGLTPEEQFDAASFPYVKIKCKVVGSLETLSEFFWGSTVTPGPVAETNYQFHRDDTEEWVEYVEKIQDTSFGTWEGTVTDFRFDPIQGAVTGEELVYVEYIAFFATEEEALAWQPQAPAAEIEAPAAEPAEDAAPAETAAEPVGVPAAAQTADLFSVSIITLAIASAAGVVICRKKSE